MGGFQTALAPPGKVLPTVVHLTVKPHYSFVLFASQIFYVNIVLDSSLSRSLKTLHTSDAVNLLWLVKLFIALPFRSVERCDAICVSLPTLARLIHIKAGGR